MVLNIQAIYEKGSPDEVENFIYQFVDLLGDGLVQRCVENSFLISIV